MSDLRCTMLVTACVSPPCFGRWLPCTGRRRPASSSPASWCMQAAAATAFRHGGTINARCDAALSKVLARSGFCSALGGSPHPHHGDDRVTPAQRRSEQGQQNAPKRASCKQKTRVLSCCQPEAAPSPGFSAAPAVAYTTS